MIPPASRRNTSSLSAFLALALALPASAAGQARAHTAWTRADTALGTPSPILQAPATGGPNPFLVEAAGGIGGSILGVTAGYWISDLDDCAHTEDLECIFQGIATMFLGGTVGAAVGSYGAGRWADTDPSGWGAALGSVVGFGVGIGVLKALEEASPDMELPTVVITYGMIQGVVTAIGSRLGAR